MTTDWGQATQVIRMPVRGVCALAAYCRAKRPQGQPLLTTARRRSGSAGWLSCLTRADLAGTTTQITLVFSLALSCSHCETAADVCSTSLNSWIPHNNFTKVNCSSTAMSSADRLCRRACDSKVSETCSAYRRNVLEPGSEPWGTPYCKIMTCHQILIWIHPTPNALLSIAALMLNFYYNKIKIKFTKRYRSKQKLQNIYTIIDRQAFKTIKNTMKMNYNQLTHESD